MINSQLQSVLTSSCQSDYIDFASPVDLILFPTEVRQPDIVMVHRDQIAIITRRGIEGVPDLTAEILSPHSIKRDKHSKLHTYAKYGVPEYWIIDPANEVLEQYKLTEGRYHLNNLYEKEETIHSDRLSCVSFTIGQILAPAAGLPG